MIEKNSKTSEVLNLDRLDCLLGNKMKAEAVYKNKKNTKKDGEEN